MRFTVEHPVGQAGCAPGLYGPEGLAEFARAAEEAGFGAVAFTEHPAPSLKWLRAGGHASLDPLAALAFCAAATTRIRLLTYLLVLPYRNPLLAAKSVATVDLLSGGRLTLGVGGGYLRSEFAALGADFEARGALLDESLEVLRGLWSGDSFGFSGRAFTARDQVSVPAPVQRPHPPVWIGGNGRNARRRAARAAQGWSPLLIDERFAATTRTAALSTPDDLAKAVTELRELTEAQGRDPGALDVQVQSRHSDVLVDGGSLDEHRGHVRELAAAGATWFVVRVPASGLSEAKDALERYGREVIGEPR